MTKLPLLTALTLALATPAAAQMSDSYNLLKAVRDLDGTKATAILNQANGSVLVNTQDQATREGVLHIAVKKRNALWLGFLLQKGAQPDLKDRDGNTPLLIATGMGWTDGMSQLLDRRANVEIGNGLGETPLLRAVQNRDLAAVKLLLAAGANAKRATASSGQSPRDIAAADPRAGLILKEIDAANPKPKAKFGPN